MLSKKCQGMCGRVISWITSKNSIGMISVCLTLNCVVYRSLKTSRVPFWAQFVLVSCREGLPSLQVSRSARPYRADCTLITPVSVPQHRGKQEQGLKTSYSDRQRKLYRMRLLTEIPRKRPKLTKFSYISQHFPTPPASLWLFDLNIGQEQILHLYCTALRSCGSTMVYVSENYNQNQK